MPPAVLPPSEPVQPPESQGGGNQATGGRLEATLRLDSEWGTGYCAQVKLQNKGSSAIASWAVRLALSGATLTQLWNATRAPDSDVFLPLSADWSRRIAPGATQGFGFCADKPVPFSPPRILSVE